MSKKVLIVDDDSANVKYLSTVLNENGYTPLSANDGVEGIKRAEEEHPDLIVLDVMMPKKSGFGVFRSLKKSDTLKDIPVIMLTSVQQVIDEGKKGPTDDAAFNEIKDHFLDKMEKIVDNHRSNSDVRPDVFMDKPIDPDEFLKAVSGLLGAA